MSDSLFERGGSQPRSVDFVPQSVPLFAATPYLYDCLKSSVDENKKVIKGCTVRLGFHLHEVQICVTDEHYKKYAYLVLDPYKTLAEALEEVLSAGALNWQDSRSKR